MAVNSRINNALFDSRLLDGIAIFVGLVNCKSFTQAALASGHSASHISKQVNKLESRLGVRLLNRTTRHLSLTSEGQLFFERCQQLVLDAEQAQSMVLGQQQQPKGRLRISCPVFLGVAKLNHLFAAYMTQYPQVDLALELNDRKVDLVSEGFDIAIRATQKMEDSSLISRKILEDTVLTVAAPCYLEKHGNPSTPFALSQHKGICYSNNNQPNVWEFIDKQGHLQTVQVSSHVLTNNAEMEVNLCVQGKGIMQMPRFNLQGQLERGELVELFTDYPKKQVNLFLVYPSRHYMSSKVRSFIDFMLHRIKDIE